MSLLIDSHVEAVALPFPVNVHRQTVTQRHWRALEMLPQPFSHPTIKFALVGTLHAAGGGSLDKCS